MSTAVLAPARVSKPASGQRIAVYGVVTVYAAIVSAAIHYHEPWADEAQAWLLARDASLVDLWTRLLHYEGSPGLWHTLLHILMRLGLLYSGYNLVSGILGLAAVWLLVRYSPLPLFARLLLPFTYYICYQYSIVARSYALLPLLLFATAVIYKRAARKPFLFTALLCLMAGVSVHGVVVSGCIWLVVYKSAAFRWTEFSLPERRRLIASAAVYFLILLFVTLCAWPAKDVAFAEHRGDLSSFAHLLNVSGAIFGQAFTGNWASAIAVIALSAPFLWKGGGWLVFILPSILLCVFGTVVYAQVWHYGIVFLIWIFAMWISALNIKPGRAAQLALAIVIGVQGYWTYKSIVYDWKRPYSGSLEAARFLRNAKIPSGRLYAIGYSCTALQPYFSANLYSNWHNGAPVAYWDWSKRNTADDASALLSSPNRDFVLIGYRAVDEKNRWRGLLELIGYRQTNHFGGNTFWHDRTFETESFDLYRRGAGGRNPRISSAVNTASSTEAIQLLNGFYGVEQNAWRWTAKKFSILLNPPASAGSKGAKLVLRLYIPDTQIQKLGAMTLRADVDGDPLPARTFSKPGAYIYSAEVPAAALRVSPVTVNFQFDKAAQGSKSDGRELGAVASFAALQPE